MNRFTDWLRTFNEDWNDLPRRLLWIVGMFAVLALILLVFPYIAPFALAALFAWMLDPVVRFATKLLGGSRAVRGIVSGVLVSLLAGLVIFLLLVLTGRVFEELKALASALPGWINDISTAVSAWIDGLNPDIGLAEVGVQEALLRLLAEATSMLTTIASQLASTAARFAIRTAGMLPKGILFTVLMLVGTFYMSADKERVWKYIRSLLPEKYAKRSSEVRTSILRAVLSQLRAAMIMMAVIFGELSVGFMVMGLDYAILFALIIAVLDALPVLGAGLFLIPMFIYGLAFGQVSLAVGGAVLYLLTIFLRQLLEPRIIGRQLGLYPLATMMAMYAGLHAMGFLGMLLGPMMLLLCKVVFTAK